MSEAIFVVRVTPRAGRDEVMAWQDGELRVRLRAAPAEGRANEGLRRLLAKRLGVAPSAVAIVSGGASRTKRVRVEGISKAALERLGG